MNMYGRVMLYRLVGVLAALVFCGATQAVPLEVPSVFENGRIFALVRDARLPAQTLRFWVDTDGSGFVLSSSPAAALGNLQIEPPLGAAGKLAVLRAADVSGNRIFDRMDGQLGWSWLTGHIWTFAYPAKRLTLQARVPAHAARDEVRLRLLQDRYPIVDAVIGDEHIETVLDTAATVVLNARAGETRRPVASCASAVALYRRAGEENGVDAIEVPSVRLAHIDFKHVWITTRPNDDVFEGEAIGLKLGPSAFEPFALTIDYVNRIAVFAKAR